MVRSTSCRSAGTTPAEFAYEDEDKREVFDDLIRDAVALATGPTRITRHAVDGVEVSSSLVMDPDGPNRRSLGVACSNSITYLKARLAGRRSTQEVIDFPPSRGNESAIARACRLVEHLPRLS